MGRPVSAWMRRRVVSSSEDKRETMNGIEGKER
jgi:hypothetical protein